MSPMTYADFLNSLLRLDGLSSYSLAYRGTVPVLTTQQELLHEPVWCFAERQPTGTWEIDPQHSQHLYLMARWITYGYGSNTTGSGPLRTETEKDVLIPLSWLLDKVCPSVTWAQACQLFRAVTTGTLGETGQYSETLGDGVLEEYYYQYAYQAVKLYPLYEWLSDNGLL